MPPPNDEEENGDNDREHRRDRENYRRDREEDRRDSQLQGLRLDVQVAVIEQRLRQAVIEINALRRELRVLHEDLEKITNLANKYRGGLLMMLAVGGLVGWLTTIYQNIIHQIK